MHSCHCAERIRIVEEQTLGSPEEACVDHVSITVRGSTCAFKHGDH